MAGDAVLILITDDDDARPIRVKLLIGTAEGLRFRDLHTALSYGACLVKTQHIDTREGLDAVHILHQRLSLCKSYRAYRKDDTCQQDKSLGYHAYDRGNGAYHCSVDRLSGNEDAVIYKRGHKREYTYRNALENGVYRTHHL